MEGQQEREEVMKNMLDTFKCRQNVSRVQAYGASSGNILKKEYGLCVLAVNND